MEWRLNHRRKHLGNLVGTWGPAGSVAAVSISGLHIVAFVRRSESASETLEHCLGTFDDSGRLCSVQVIPDIQAASQHDVATLLPLSENELIAVISPGGSSHDVRVDLYRLENGAVRQANSTEIEFSGPASHPHVLPLENNRLAIFAMVKSKGGAGYVLNLESFHSEGPEFPVLRQESSAPEDAVSELSVNWPDLITRPCKEGTLFAARVIGSHEEGDDVYVGIFSTDSTVKGLDGNTLYSLGADQEMPFTGLTKFRFSDAEFSIWPQDIAENADGSVTLACLRHRVPSEPFEPDGVTTFTDLEYSIIRLTESNAENPRHFAAGRSMSPESPYLAAGISLNPRVPSSFVLSSSKVSALDGASSMESRFWALFSADETSMGTSTRIAQDQTKSADFSFSPKFSRPLDAEGSHALLLLRAKNSISDSFEREIQCVPLVPGQNCFSTGNHHFDFPFGKSHRIPLTNREAEGLNYLLTFQPSVLVIDSPEIADWLHAQSKAEVVAIETDAYWADFLNQQSPEAPPRFAVSPEGLLFEEKNRKFLGSDQQVLGFFKRFCAEIERHRNDCAILGGVFRLSLAFQVVADNPNLRWLVVQEYAEHPFLRVLEIWLGKPSLHGNLAIFSINTDLEISGSLVEAFAGIQYS